MGEVIPAGTIEKIFSRLHLDNGGGSLARIENITRDERGLFDPAHYVCIERDSEYIYLRDEIARLQGKAFKSQRHDVNLVKRSVAPVYRRYAAPDREACRQLFERWFEKKIGLLDGAAEILPRLMLLDARGIHAYLWDFAETLNLEGRVVEVDGRLAAYTFGCRLNDETFCILVEVADPAIAGLASFIFQAFADDEAVRPYPYLNTMDDCGLSAIARTKLSWRPMALEPVYTATPVFTGSVEKFCPTLSGDGKD
jgi:hypothetical protein